MSKLIIDSLVTFLSVFGGLFALWSVMSQMTRKQRFISAVVAGTFSALITIIISGTIIGST